MGLGDRSWMPLSFEEGLNEIDDFYQSPSQGPELTSAQPNDCVAEGSKVEEFGRKSQNDQSPFAQMAKDIETLPDDALFGGNLAPTGRSSPGSGTTVPTNHYSSMALSPSYLAESSPDMHTRTSRITPKPRTFSTPAQRSQRSGAPSSSVNRSGLYAEMRSEEEEGTSPIQDSPPSAKFALPGQVLSAASPSRSNIRSYEEMFARKQPSALHSDQSPTSQKSKRDRPSSSPSTDTQPLRKKAKEGQQSPTDPAIPRKSFIIAPGNMTSAPMTLMPAMGLSRRSGGEGAGTLKKREKDVATEDNAKNTTVGPGSVKRAPRKAISQRELSSTVGDTNIQNLKQSPRKTRTQRTTELNSQPNAGAAAKRRHSTNLK